MNRTSASLAGSSSRLGDEPALAVRQPGTDDRASVAVAFDRPRRRACCGAPMSDLGRILVQLALWRHPPSKDHSAPPASSAVHIRFFG
jgi:hypothetical protein